MVSKKVIPEAIIDINEATQGLDEKSFEKLKVSLDQVCQEVASKFNLHNSKNQPRKATIVDCIANSTCIGCVAKELSNRTPSQRIDSIYLECHKFAVGTLIEELQSQFNKRGYCVSIYSEAQTEYGKVDVLIKPTYYGLQLKCGSNEIIVEVKTGTSISLSQIFRYLLDKENQRLVLWRIRNRQILVLDGENLKPILMQFMNTCVLRGERLLKAKEVDCDHPSRNNNWLPTQVLIQEMLEDFTTALLETLPRITKTIFKTLKVNEGTNLKKGIDLQIPVRNSTLEVLSRNGS